MSLETPPLSLTTCQYHQNDVQVSKLLHKLEHYGVRGTEMQWFKNKLTSKKQTVTFESIQMFQISDVAYHRDWFLVPKYFSSMQMTFQKAPTILRTTNVYFMVTRS